MKKCYKITPDWIRVGLLVFVLILSFVFVLLGIDDGPSIRSADPRLLLVLSLLLIIMELKFTYIEYDQISIRYCFLIKKVIPREHISNISFIQKKNACYLLITLVGKDWQKQNGMSAAKYATIRDRKIIKIRVSYKQETECIENVSRLFPSKTD